MANVIVPKIFKELFIPNHTEQEKKKFTPQYKAEIRRRLLRGEEISDSEIGVKTFVLMLVNYAIRQNEIEYAKILGEKYIQMGNKIVITSGTYARPKVTRLISFPNEQEADRFINKLWR